MIKIEADTAGAIRDLVNLKNCFKSSEALQTFSSGAQEFARSTANQYIDRPTPGTINSIKVYFRADQSGQATMAIYIDSDYEDALSPIIFGETVEGLYGSNNVIRPVNIPTDQFGNIPNLRSQMQNFRSNRRRYLEVPLGEEGRYNNLHAGIYERQNQGGRRRLNMLIAFEERRQYEITWPLMDLLDEYHNRFFVNIYTKEVEKCLSNNGSLS